MILDDTKHGGFSTATLNWQRLLHQKMLGDSANYFERGNCLVVLKAEGRKCSNFLGKPKHCEAHFLDTLVLYWKH